MKKKVMSDAALAAMVGAQPEAADVENVELNDQETPEVDAAEELDNVEQPEASTESLTVEAVQADFDAYKAEMEGKLAELEAANSEAIEAVKAEADQKIAEVEAAAAELKAVVVSQVARMRVGLKIAAVDMTEWSADAVVTEYNAISDSFVNSFPVGGVVPTEEKKNKPKAHAIANSHLASAYKSFGIK